MFARKAIENNKQLNNQQIVDLSSFNRSRSTNCEAYLRLVVLQPVTPDRPRGLPSTGCPSAGHARPTARPTFNRLSFSWSRPTDREAYLPSTGCPSAGHARPTERPTFDWLSFSRSRLTDREAYLRLVVLQPVGLVDDEHLPVDGAERRRVDADQLIRCKQDVELDAAVLAHLRRLAAAANRAVVHRELVLPVDRARAAASVSPLPLRNRRGGDRHLQCA